MRLRGLHPDLQAAAQWCLDVAAHYGVHVEVTSVYRSWTEQEALYRRFKEGRSSFPANPPGQSAHEYGLAWDSWVDEPYRAWWTLVREYAGFRVPPNDWIHAEYPNWRAVVGPLPAYATVA